MAVHGSLSPELEEFASAFALEALLPEEAQVYVRHLQGCEFCRQLVAHCQAAADLLPLALQEEVGSPGLKQRILDQAAQELAQERGPAVELGEGDKTRKGNRWPDWMSLNPARAAVALAVVVAALVVWNVTLQLDTGEPNGPTTEQLNLIETIWSGATILELTGTEDAPDASARLVQAPDGDNVFLLPRNLPLLASDQEYEVWSIEEGVPVSVGTFALSDGRERLVSFSADMSNAQTIGISIEQKGGSPTGQPLGPIVLLGSR